MLIHLKVYRMNANPFARIYEEVIVTDTLENTDFIIKLKGSAPVLFMWVKLFKFIT